jgi:hypothetical protein
MFDKFRVFALYTPFFAAIVHDGCCPRARYRQENHPVA